MPRSFDSNCTLPPEGTNFVSSPALRGTTDIVWSCTSVILICTWSILHLNVPQQSTPSNKLQAFRRSIQRFVRKLKWFLFNLAAPEWPLGKAWANHVSVKSMEAKFAAIAKKDGIPWSRAHSNFANMGGFVIKFGMKNDLTNDPNIWVVDASQLLLARELGIIDRLPTVLQDDLDDRNKGDIVVKILAVGQIGWFVIQLCVRFAARLATSQLEILTLAYALCTVITYFLLRDTPKDCQFSLSVPAVRHPSPSELFRVALLGPMPYMLLIRDHFWIPDSYVHADHTMPMKGNLFAVTVGSIVAVFLLGCVHCIAWDFVFPTDIERTFWQASSIMTAAAIPVGFLLGLVHTVVLRATRIDQQLYRRISSVIFSYSCVLLGVLFFVSRIFIVVEALRSLAFLPPNVYATTWSVNIPHIRDGQS
ncbi:hypothetical protein GGX14DRAFT_520129 [Mycena pura]|uniref:Uncharacterized protein n=1 Tax=Mycena pura TaxID=153505 RepID=A0AAD6VIT4_9AGAR|nr:hypothetical protein GGX14DRAFT_520129 [Mycena pura]